MVATFVPPHPPPVFRVLKQAYREYLAGGNAAAINVTTPPNQAAAATTTVAGTVEVDRAVPMPAAVTVVLKNGATTKGTQSATVNPTTGAYTTTFPGSTLAAGAATATVSSASPVKSVTTPNFTVT
jgi:hypothetical protein